MSSIPDSHATQQPHHVSRPVASSVRATLAPANDPSPSVPLRPYAARPAHMLDGLRCVPLASFVWGGHGGMRRARVRNDSVLAIVREGHLRLDLPRSGQDHGAGKIVFIPMGSAFAAHSSADASGQVLLIPRGLTRNLALPLPDRLCAGSPPADLHNEIERQIAGLMRDAATPTRNARMAVELRLGLLSIGLDRDDAFLNRAATAPTAQRPSREQHDIVDTFLTLARRELGRGRTISDLAQALGLTTESLDTACREQRGRTALDLIYQLRLDRALSLLRSSDLSVATIATQLGYSGVGHLTRAFMAATGRPPESFRAPSVAAS